jgi:hypothetical protein
MADANLTPSHDPLSELTMLVQRTKQMALELPQARRSSYGLLDGTERAMDIYRVIAGICGEALERLRTTPPPVSPDALDVAQALLRIARLCTTEYDTHCKEEEQRRIRTRRWSEVHDEFEAAQREGRPMRSDWSWERQARWEGPIT